MAKYIVTVKLPKNPEHDPRNKKTGACRFAEVCTDVTGEHHSLLLESESEESIRRYVDAALDLHITRIEKVS